MDGRGRSGRESLALLEPELSRLDKDGVPQTDCQEGPGQPGQSGGAVVSSPANNQPGSSPDYSALVSNRLLHSQQLSTLVQHRSQSGHTFLLLLLQVVVAVIVSRTETPPS